MIIKIKIKIKKIDHIGVKGDVPIIWNIWGTFKRNINRNLD
jgi:hypothetical protein